MTLSYAQSLDGCLAAEPNRRMALSGAATLRLTHQLRANHAAILVGIGTALADDPRLTVRLVEGPHPQPIVVDTHLRLPPTARLLRESPHQLWIATGPAPDAGRAARLTAAGAQLLCLPLSASGMIDLMALVERLGALQIASLMVEGGPRILTSFLSSRLANQLVLTISPQLLGSRLSIGPLSATPGPPRLTNVVYAHLEPDLVVRADLDWGTA